MVKAPSTTIRSWNRSNRPQSPVPETLTLPVRAPRLARRHEVLLDVVGVEPGYVTPPPAHRASLTPWQASTRRCRHRPRPHVTRRHSRPSPPAERRQGARRPDARPVGLGSGLPDRTPKHEPAFPRRSLLNYHVSTTGDNTSATGRFVIPESATRSGHGPNGREHVRGPGTRGPGQGTTCPSGVAFREGVCNNRTKLLFRAPAAPTVCPRERRIRDAEHEGTGVGDVRRPGERPLSVGESAARRDDRGRRGWPARSAGWSRGRSCFSALRWRPRR